ncbi:MAG: calcium/sodium antiporter [Flavobacteriales bacterium]|nr:calcium/sodium antiporter [Flavobacteriales bacterium]
MNEYILLVLGLVTLVIGGELLVKGAVGLSVKLKISTLVIGMTVVSFGTSAPELIVSCKAALGGNSDISIGGVVGSNIANLGLVLGLTALVFPIVIDKNSLRLDWPAMITATVIFYLFILDGVLSMFEGITFLVLILGFTIFLIRRSIKKNKSDNSQEETGLVPVWRSIVFLMIGCAGLAYGAEWFLDGAVTIAKKYDVSDRIIGITLVAFGTSIPELATSVIAAIRKQPNLSIGNLIGSNIFNILVVLGVTSVIQEIKINQLVLTWDIFWMFGVAILLLPLMIIGNKISRFDGFVLFGFYFAYIYTTIS